uniref:Uncharacterized protein n=1 Tax=Plectus sambesii TaxID=2011161 RepID=A0A914V0U1_9BILA
MTAVAAKRCALQAILGCPRCCCVPPQVLLTSLLADLPDHKDNQHLLIRCLGVHLIPSGHTLSIGQSQRVSVGGSTTQPLEYACRVCSEDGEVRRSEASGYVSALSEYFSSASDGVLNQLCKLVSRILPGLDAAGKELLVANAVLPRLSQQCKASVGDSKKQPNGAERDERLIVALLKIVSQGVCGPKAYKSLVKHFFPFADFLFDCPMTQKPFVLCLERGVLLENSTDLAQLEKPLTRYVFDRFLLAMRAATVDLSTLISDSASRFYQVVTVTLDMCHAFLLHKCSGMDRAHF